MAGVAVKDTANGSEGLGFDSRAGQIGQSTTVRHRSDVSSQLCCSDAKPLCQAITALIATNNNHYYLPYKHIVMDRFFAYAFRQPY